jgi:hypothetical protein
MNTAVQNLAKDYADDIQRDLRSEHYWAENNDLIEWLENVLDIQVIGKRNLSSNEWDVTGYRLCLGWGGPNVWLEIDPNGQADLEVYWDTHETRYIGELPDLLSTLKELEYI